VLHSGATSDVFLRLCPFLFADRDHHGKFFIERRWAGGVRSYQKIIELLAVTPADGIAALAMLTVIFIGMRFLYGAWPWESRKTCYCTRPFVPVMAPPEEINCEAEEITADTDSDHFNRKLIAPEQV
jgi:hypothetical protein